MLIDSHCHLHDQEFFTKAEAFSALEQAHHQGVGRIICVGTSHEDSLSARDFATQHEGVYWTYGVHPESAGQKWQFPDNSTPVAIGEVGLDYHYEGYDRSAQIKLFEEMLQLAVDHDLPLSFHVREAFADFFPVVSNFPSVRGVVHSFTDSKKTLKRILNETDFLVGVNGLATYSTLPTPPIDRILLETDAPFLAPVPHRGEQNQPAYIPAIASWLAHKLGLPLEEVERTTTANTIKLFSLPSES